MNKLKNFIYLLIFTGILLLLKNLVIDKLFISLPEDAGIWFTSGILLVILGIFITEKYFTKSLDVIVNLITLGIVLFTLDNPSNFRLWGALLFYMVFVGASAILSFILFNEEKDQSSWSQRISKFSGIFARFLGSARFLFSLVFILSIFNYFVFSLKNSQAITNEQLSIILLIIFWAIILLIEPIDRKLISPVIKAITNKSGGKIIGKVIKRISPNLIVIEVFNNNFDSKSIFSLGDYEKIDKKDLSILVNVYSQNTKDKTHLFLYSMKEISNKFLKEKYVYLIESGYLDENEIAKDFELYKNKGELVGFVHSGSDIDILKIRMVNEIDEEKEIKEGDLVSVNFYGGYTKYQILNVETNFEIIDGESKQGIKIITAQQIGRWRNKDQKFEDSFWVPKINTPVFLENSSEEMILKNKNWYKVGVIPKSNYPICLDLDKCVNHHIAIIGKTGTGKSRMAGNIIEKMADIGYKIIILEVDRKNKQSLTSYINDDITEEQKSNEFDLLKSSKPIILINWQLEDKDQSGGTLNLSDIVANLINKVVSYQVKNEQEKICIVMEEAYDFIPENNFGKQDYGQPKVSRISQTVLKCRKHNIGFLIITQRTALVTKTILYQCNTIVALQSFDETSKNFMGAYINQKYLDGMSILPRFRAIVVGKGSTCDKPVIVNFYDKTLDN